jgi:hypothetical protein
MVGKAEELYSHHEYVRVIQENVFWPGVYFPQRTIREKHSRSFTNDFFGRTEVTATIKSLYSQIGKAIIDSFAELGFDVSEYRDRDGNYTINADKIGQVFIGQQIKVTQTEEMDEIVSDNSPVGYAEESET